MANQYDDEWKRKQHISGAWSDILWMAVDYEHCF